jgi:hypothetical protein
MKILQKLIFPVLLLAVIILVYTVYFSPSKGLGSFSDFDPNNNAVKDIKVTVVLDKGVNNDSHGGVVFYAADKDNNVIVINADKVSLDIESAEIVILRGHMSQNNSFHAHDVIPD